MRVSRHGGMVNGPPPAQGQPERPRTGDALYQLSPRVIWRYLLTQPASLWFINLYIFFEYVRPQSIYESIAGPPYAKALILLALAAFIYEGKMFRVSTLADAALWFFTAVLLLSSVQAFRPVVAYDALTDYLSWVLVFLLISNIVTTERRFLVTMLAFLLYSLKMSQHAARSWAGAGFAFRDWGVTGGPGWFHNSGEFGIQMTIFIPMLAFFIFGLRRHWNRKLELVFWGVMLTAVIGTVGSSSRGAMLGMAAVLLFIIFTSPYKLNGALILIPMSVLAFFLIPEESMERFRAMGSDGTSTSRFDYWKAGIETMKEHPVLGIGYNNWTIYMIYTFGGMGLAHNIFVQAGAELGYTGLLALIGMMLATFVTNFQTRQMLKPLGDRGNFLRQAALGLDGALIGFMVSGSFVTVLYYPYLWFNLAFTVALYRSAQDLVEKAKPAQPMRRPGVAARTRRRPVHA